jgi:hypothetical protein
MQKLAQKRSILNKLYEKANIPAAMMETFFKPELDRVMNDLRQKDDNIRSILTGQKIGKSNVEFAAGPSIKDIIKSARKNFNRHEYMAGVADLGQFHKRMFDVKKYIKDLEMSVDEIHHRFLWQKLSPEQKKHIEDMEGHMTSLPPAAAEMQAEMIKEAGLLDTLHNILNTRGRSLAIWEKKYPKVAKELREQGSNLIDTAQSVLGETLSLLKEMATYRATRSVDNYLASAKKIIKAFDKFDVGFRTYYEKVVKPTIEKQRAIEAKESGQTGGQTGGTPVSGEKPEGFEGNSAVPDATQMGQQQISVPPAGEAAQPDTSRTPMPAMKPTVLQAPGGPPGAGPLGAPPGIPATPAQQIPEAPITLKDVTTAHSRFLQSLETLSNEDPRILASYIAKYAKSIQNTDTEVAVKLFEMARKIRE